MSPTKLILLAAWLGAFLAGFDFAAIYVALPVIADNFKVDLSSISWIVLSYTLVFVSFTISVGTLGKRFGIRRMLFAGFFIFGALSIPCALSTGIYTLAISRAIQALGGAMLYVLGPAVLRTMVPHGEQEKAFGIFAFAPYVGLSLGPGLGGLITFYLGWPWIFLINVPVCLAGLLALRAMPTDQSVSKNSRKAPLDIMGSVLGFVFLSCLIVAVNQGKEWGWSSPVIIGCFAGFLITFAAFLWWEVRNDNSVINLSLFGHRIFGFSLISIFFILFASGGANFLFPIHTEWYKGLSVQNAGFVLMTMAVGLAISSLQAERLAKQFYDRDLCIAGLIIAAVSLTIYVFGRQATPLWVFALAMGAFGFGLGIHYPLMMRLAMQSVPTENSVQAATAMSSVRSAAQLLGIVVFESTFSEIYLIHGNPHCGSRVSARSIDQMSTGFSVTFAIGVALCLVAVIPILFLGRSEKEMIAS
jgi:EmrB/QacA subfamily drug resistance transporter